MAQFAAFWAKIASLISTIRIPDIVDILLVAYLIYKLTMLIRKTNSYRVARGIVLILIVLWLSGELKLTMIHYLLQKTVELGLIALVILFQPELRRLLERMGSNIPVRLEAAGAFVGGNGDHADDHGLRRPCGDAYGRTDRV